MIKNLSIAIILVLFASCQRQSRLEMALRYAGENRPELEKVLAHYSHNPQDFLKLRAAKFLIEEMPGHYSYNTTQIKEYYDRAKNIYQQSDDLAYRKEALQKLSDSTKRFISTIEDIQYINHQYLIRSIDRSFELWENHRWAKHLTFDEFCEYLLPYKVIDTQYLDEWKQDLYSRFESDTLLYQTIVDHNHMNLEKAIEINKTLQEAIPPIIYLVIDIIPLLATDFLEYMAFGKCDDYSHITNMVMRSKGIPVAFDFTPQWANRSYGHSWNVLFNNDGRLFDFPGMSGEGPGNTHLRYDRPSKIYRKTYSSNDNITKLLKAEKNVPKFAQSVFMTDVTSDYIKTTNVEIKNIFINSVKYQYGYLAVFDNISWSPVAFGKKRRDKIFFKDIARNNIYLPVLYLENDVHPINYPFRLNYDNSLTFFKPDTTNRFSFSFGRKYPVRRRMYFPGSRWIGGEVHAANRSDFSDAIIVHKIDRFCTEVSINTDSVPPYRYWRYFSSPEGHMLVSEMMFIDASDSTKCISGKIIGSDGSWQANPKTKKEAMFDGNLLTRYYAQNASGDWAGMDFGEPIKIRKILLYPNSDGNSVEFGDVYDLFYYDKKGWVSLGRKKATDVSVCFDNIPSNAIYLLDDITKGKEKRIFTIDNGKIIWW